MKNINWAFIVAEFYKDLRYAVSTANGAAYIHNDTLITYPLFMQMAERIHSRLGVCRGIPVVSIIDKDVISYAAVLAIILSGNTWVPLSPSVPSSRNADVLKTFDHCVLITNSDLAPELSDATNEHVIDVIDLRDIRETSPARPFGEIDINPDSNAMIYFTSGSTGEPKGVQVTHMNYIAVIRNLLSILDWPGGDVVADYHELSFVISIPVLFSCWMTQSAIAPALSAEETFLPIENLVDNKVTVLMTVPSTIARVKRARPNGIDDLDLRVLINCGEPLHLDILDYSLDLAPDGQVYNFYGSTEVAPWTFYHHCHVGDSERFASLGYAPVGKLLPGNEMRLDTETSELLVAGPQITPGYLSERDAHRFKVIDGRRWYCTGDKVIEYEGFFVCKGRLDTQVKVSGYRVELMDVEAHLRKIPDVEGAVCFARDDKERTSIIVAVLNSKRDISISEVRRHLKQFLPAYMVPREVHVLDSAPINKSGKIDRLAIKKMFENGE